MDYQVMLGVGRVLMKLLWRALEPVRASLNNISETDIRLDSPVDLDGSKPQLSVFLYQVSENAHMKNRELLPTADPRVRRLPPLALTLHYLVTPSAGNRDLEALMLGRVMQALYDRAVVDSTALAEPGWSVPPELHIVLSRLSIEDLTRIWGAFTQDQGSQLKRYRVSAAYDVTPVLIDSSRDVTGAPVLLKQVEYEMHGAPAAAGGGAGP